MLHLGWRTGLCANPNLQDEHVHRFYRALRRQSSWIPNSIALLGYVMHACAMGAVTSLVKAEYMCYYVQAAKANHMYFGRRFSVSDHTY